MGPIAARNQKSQAVASYDTRRFWLFYAVRPNLERGLNNEEPGRQAKGRNVFRLGRTAGKGGFLHAPAGLVTESGRFTPSF